MFSWEWQDFEEVITKLQFAVESVGPLKGPIQSFMIKRDAKLQLTMLTHAPVSAEDGGISYPPGTVRTNTEKVIFVSNTGAHLVAEGVQPEMTRTTVRNDPPLAELQQDCSIHRLRGTTSAAPVELKYLIEWLGNVPSGFHWPDIMDELTEVKKTRKFAGRIAQESEGDTAAKGLVGREGGAWNCARLVVGGAYPVFVQFAIEC